MAISFKHLQPRVIVHIGTILFVISISFAYTIYPHWVTLSHFAEQWYTLIPFIFAMLVAMLELGYIATKVRRYGGPTVGANFLYASALFVGFVICIPYLGAAAQKNIHNLAALLFALSGAVGFATLARRLHNYALGALSGLISVICILELVLLARYKAHPVYSWVWTVLELAVIASLIAALDVTAAILGKDTRANRTEHP